MRQIIKFVKCNKGATAVEYGLMVALIAVVIIIAVAFLGTEVASNFSEVGSTIDAAGN